MCLEAISWLVIRSTINYNRNKEYAPAAYEFDSIRVMLFQFMALMVVVFVWA